MQRLRIWRELIAQGWWKYVTLGVTLVGIVQVVFSQFFPSYEPAVLGEVVPDWWTWQMWVVIVLLTAWIATLETAYLRIRGADEQLRVIETDPEPEDASQLKLIDSFPKDNQSITKDQVRQIFLKFNKPVDKENEGLICNYHVRCNLQRQWNTGGWVEYDEDDTKLIWHVDADKLQNTREYGPMEPYDYQMFEIRVPHSETQPRFRAADGGRLPRTVIRVKIKPESETRQ